MRYTQHITNISHVWITRPQDDADQMAEQIAALGMTAWVLPVLAIVPYPADTSAQDILNQADQIIVTSRHAVTGAEQQGLRLPTHAQWFAVGKATANALSPFQIQTILPDTQDTEGLLALAELSNVQGKQIVILKGVGGRPVLAQQLTRRGATVTEVSLYQRQCAHPSAEHLINYLNAEGQHIIALASGETLECLLNGLNNHQRHLIMTNTHLAVMSERVEQRALDAGWQPHQITTATSASLSGLITAISASVTSL